MPSRIPSLPHPCTVTWRAARVRLPPLSLLFEQGFLGRLAGTRRTSSPGRARPGRLVPAVIGTDALPRAVAGPAHHVPCRDLLGRSDLGRDLHGRTVLAAWLGSSLRPAP